MYATQYLWHWCRVSGRFSLGPVKWSEVLLFLAMCACSTYYWTTYNIHVQTQIVFLGRHILRGKTSSLFDFDMTWAIINTGMYMNVCTNWTLANALCTRDEFVVFGFCLSSLVCSSSLEPRFVWCLLYRGGQSGLGTAYRVQTTTATTTQLCTKYPQIWLLTVNNMGIWLWTTNNSCKSVSCTNV